MKQTTALAWAAAALFCAEPVYGQIARHNPNYWGGVFNYRPAVNTILPNRTAKQNQFDRSNWRRSNRQQNQSYGDSSPGIYWAGDYSNNGGNNQYIGPKRYLVPNAYTDGRFGYAGPNGYSAPDGYAGPYGYPFDNPVWWDYRFHRNGR